MVAAGMKESSGEETSPDQSKSSPSSLPAWSEWGRKAQFCEDNYWGCFAFAVLTASHGKWISERQLLVPRYRLFSRILFSRKDAARMLLKTTASCPLVWNHRESLGQSLQKGTSIWKPYWPPSFSESSSISLTVIYS